MQVFERHYFSYQNNFTEICDMTDCS